MSETQSPDDFRRCVDASLAQMRELFAPTPLQLNDHLSARYGAQGSGSSAKICRRCRSYKIRGAFNFIRKALAANPEQNLFVCASAGNHAQGFAYVCRHFGRKGVVFMPVTTPQQKIEKTRVFGGEFIEIRLTGDFFDACYDAAREFAAAEGALMAPPFDHDDIIEGQASVGAEIEAQLPEGEAPDLVVLPVGGGGLSAGVARYLEGRVHAERFLLVEPDGAPSLKESLAAGHRVKLGKIDNFVDGAAVAEIGERNFEILQRFRAEQVLTVPENAICLTMTRILNTEGIVLEPAGALSLAALEVHGPGKPEGQVGRGGGLGRQF
jgi:threonine dehydratase